MLSNNTRKVYIVNNFKSENIEQVIFILKSNKKNNTTDIAIEAQNIINNYANKLDGYSFAEKKPLIKHKKDFKFLKILGTSLIFFIIGIITLSLIYK